MPQFETHFFSSLIFWEVVSFAILLFVLWKFAFPPIMAMLEERERKIRESLEQADRTREQAEHRLKEYETKLAGAAREAEDLLNRARERAQVLQDENEKRMQADAERIKDNAAREIDHERRRAIQEIRDKTIDLSLIVAEKVVGRSLTDADHKRLAEETLSSVAEYHKT